MPPNNHGYVDLLKNVNCKMPVMVVGQIMDDIIERYLTLMDYKSVKFRSIECSFPS